MSATEIQLLNGKIYQECLGYALTLTQNATTAHDLVQEAYYKAFKRHHQFESGSNLRAWMKTIVYNTFVTTYRLEKRRRELATHVPRQNHWMTMTVTDNAAPTQMAADSILTLVNQLKDIYRRPFLLHLQGMQYNQIARSFNLPIGTVKSRVFTARQQLRTLLTAEHQLLEAAC